MSYRNVLYCPGFTDPDLSVFKNIPIGELHIQLHAEMFNVLNRKNMATGPGSAGSNGVVSDTIGDFNAAPGLGPGERFNMQPKSSFSGTGPCPANPLILREVTSRL
jgi:hypothetical protein